MTTTATTTKTLPPVNVRLAALRRLMAQSHVDAVIVRSTDPYLNEYVPVDESTRVFITGFRGSMGDALITADAAYLIVDGRYTLQAKTEAAGFEVTVVPLGTSIEEGWLSLFPSLKERGVRAIGVETDRVTVALMKTIRARADVHGLTLVPTVPSLIARARDELALTPPSRRGKIWSVTKELSGRTVKERLALVAPTLEKARLDGVVVIPLDALAWLTNLRGDHFPFQATFRAAAVALKDEVVVAADPRALKAGDAVEDGVRLVGEGKLAHAVSELATTKNGHGLRLGYDPAVTPEIVRETLVAAGAELQEIEDPFRAHRVTKTRAELAHMTDCFARADVAVKKLQSWLGTAVSRGERVTEADVEKKMEQLFKRQGAWGLSFKTIPGCGKNGAIIHYGSPDDETPIPEGALFLLDCGAYFDGGYATDLTRTFLVGKPHVRATDEMKRIFTTVLKGAIAGMSARFPRGTTGEQIDALIRAPIWRAGLNYAHGTGHGVGVNVHESPPRIAPNARGAVEPDQVFSIEPGVYVEGWGGVRIENLAICVPDPDDEKFLRVRPLTFSPFDERLIDKALLTAQEKAFLVWWKARGKDEGDRLTFPLPPLT